MSLSKLMFGKSIYELVLDDIRNFFLTEQEETSILEFKSGKVELEEIHRQVCAFLNTEGGLLILGSPIEKSISKNKKICIGELIPTSISNQDVLMRSVASNISPSPTGIKIKELKADDGKVYVIEIPQSLTPPHQASNEGKYYIRLEREAKPAPHGLVEAMFFKRQRPTIDVEFNIFNLNDSSTSVFVEFDFKNNWYLTAERIGYIVEIGGVHQLTSTKQVSSNVTLENGFLHTQGTLGDTILVKGLKTTLQFEIARSGPVLLIHVQFWCKDSNLESKCCLFDFAKWEYINIYRSMRDDNELDINEIAEIYFERMALKVPEGLVKKTID